MLVFHKPQERGIGRTMADFKTKNKIGRIAQGAAAGSIFGPVGTFVGGVIGGIASEFESDPQEELKRRRDAQLWAINNERNKRIATITQESANARQSNAQGAMARAIDTGRDPSNIEDSLLVANQQNAHASTQAINQASQYFDQQAIDVNGEYNSRPLEVPLSETLIDAGTNAVAGYYQGKSADRQNEHIKSLEDNVNAQTDYFKKQVGSSGVKIGTTGNTSGVLSSDITTSPSQFSGIVDNNSVLDSFNLNKRIANMYRVRSMAPQGAVSYGGFR